MKMRIIIYILLGVLFYAGMFFLTAGTVGYWHAWVLMGVLFVPAIFAMAYFFTRDPEFLERRMRFQEKETREKRIIRASQITFVIGMIVAGLDFRYGWSAVPLWLVVVSDIGIFCSYILVLFVFKENRYASRIIEVEPGQKLVTTGPYALVRHPMYAGVVPMYLLFPIALGSYYAFIFFAPVVALIIFRILDEERVLLRDLSGYREYMEKTPYRLIPFVW